MSASTRDVITSPPEPTFADLHQIAAGDQQVCRDFLHRWQWPVGIIASRYASRTSDLDDLRQVGLLAVYEASLNYRAGRGASFSHYVKRAIKNRIMREAERLSRQRVGEVPLDTDAGDLPVREAAPTEYSDSIAHWTRDLPEPHGTVFRLLYVDGLKQRAVAELFGKTQPWVSQLHRSILNHARSFLAS